ncbi:MAG: hypothetical protein NVSMB27_23790 [Ktedonobacteraceae bacterium]
MARFRFRYPDEVGIWHWRKVDTIIALPACLKERLPQGELLAPTLPEECGADGERFAVLDFILEVEKESLPEWRSVERVLGVDWGVHSLLTATAVDEHSQPVGRPFFLDPGSLDGRQARTRRQIDELKKKVARYEQERDALPEEHAKRVCYTQRLALYRREIDLCWRKYEQRNRALAHLASKVLLLLARVPSVIWWVCASRPARHEAPRTPVLIVASPRRRIASLPIEARRSRGDDGCGAMRAPSTATGTTALH